MHLCFWNIPPVTFTVLLTNPTKLEMLLLYKINALILPTFLGWGSLHHRVLIWDIVKEPINKKIEYVLHPPLLPSWVFHSDTGNKPPVMSSQIQPLRYSHKTGGDIFAHTAATSLLFFLIRVGVKCLSQYFCDIFFPVSPQACHPKKRSRTDFCDNFCMFCLLSISSALATSTFWRQVFRPPLFDSISLLTLHFLRSLPYHLLPSALALQISFSWLSIIPLSLSHRLLCLDLLWCLLFCSST